MQNRKINGVEFIAGRWPIDPELETIVFIHGAGGSHLLWHSQVASLADSMNTIALNLPGHGGSDDGKVIDRIEGYADSVLAFIQSIGAKRPVVCGLSMGGAIVLQLLISEQQHFSGGIVVNTGARLKTMPFIFEMIENNYKGFVNGLYTFGASSKTDPLKLKPFVDSMEQCCPKIVKADFTACDAFNVMEQLTQIKVPVLVMTATEDQLTPVKFGRFIAEQIQGAVYTNIEDAGHLSPIEKPEEITTAIRLFMAKVRT